ncbi:MAG: endolytic transglycosylase MltG [Defluviitaleaceae bacterium]|nr:endolytic transglycosylase MltG [Defluviitaleaceae bacterium]
MWRKIINISNYLAGGLFNIGLVVGIIVLAYFTVTWAFDAGYGLRGDDNAYRPDQEVLVEIPNEASALEVARILRGYELINNEWSFYFGAVLNGSHSHFLSGTFALNMNMGDQAIMEALTDMRFLRQEEGRILVREGMPNWQIANLAATLGYFTAAEFLYELENGIFLNEFLQGVPERPQRLEGFLFPDTYNLPPNPVPRDLIVRMLDRFEQVFDGQMQVQLEQLGVRLGWQPSLEQIVIIASIVEVEATSASDRPFVASVIYNRLAANMPLEMITTVVYAANTRADLLTTAQFNINSPYNTFNRVGLPIGPINNPGLNSLTSALNPAVTDYLFFAQGNDGLVFATTQAELDAILASHTNPD